MDGAQGIVRRTMDEANALVEDSGVVRANMDSALMHNKKRHLTFLRQLRSRGMLKFGERGTARAGVFFVWRRTSLCPTGEVERNTKIVYFLKEDQYEILVKMTTEDLVLKYSESADFSNELYVESLNVK